ncbi:MAG: peptide chain release factor N(5)-glutamine methyltransferase [bacterium]|nr:peptide chain release factor N(5)-glutamine methyltransferase [bacterium]
MNTTIGKALGHAIRRLTQAEIPEPRAAAEVLLADLLSLPRWQLHFDQHRVLCASLYACYVERITRRQSGEPVQYITGRQAFWSLEFEVNTDVLIPRPESEQLVEHGVRLARQWRALHPHQPLHVLDVGTGSGNLAVSLARELPHSSVCGVDRSFDALRVARRNAQRLDVVSQTRWICGDLLSPLRSHAQRFALCVSNLPYVTIDEWWQLPREIRDYEPSVALLGGDDGLALIRCLITVSSTVLAAGGSLLLEVGWKQAASVLDIMQQSGFFHCMDVYHDLAGIERVVWAQMP